MKGTGIHAEDAGRTSPRILVAGAEQKKALLLLDAQPAPLIAADLRTKASVYQAFGHGGRGE